MRPLWLSTALCLMCTALIFVFVGLLQKQPFYRPFGQSYLDFQASYQLFLLGLTTLVLGLIFVLWPEGFKRYFRRGDLKAQATALAFFGIKEGESWRGIGWSLSLMISLVTGIFMYGQLTEQANWGILGIYWPFILIFAACNAWGEEIIFRLALVAPLAKTLAPHRLFLLSAVLFGLPHYGGMPSGFIGALMAGVLGYVLAKSVYETKGLFWAWWIHFLQDMVIMSTLVIL